MTTTKINHIPDVMSEWDCHVLDMMKRRKIRQRLLDQYHELQREKQVKKDPFQNYKSGVSW